MELFLRVFAECGSEGYAEHLQRELCVALTTWVLAKPSTARRYWKMPDLFEFTFRLTPATFEARDQIIGSASGWHHSGDELDRSSVWNRSPGVSFLVAEVTWAELQHYEPAP